MRDWDLELFSHLIVRPGFYLGANNFNGIEQFIRTYQLGSKHECDFLDLLTNHLRKKYDVPMPSNGLIGQFKIISKKLNQDWEQLFVKECEEVLIKESDSNNQNRFQKILRNKLLNYFENIPEQISSVYFVNLNLVNSQIDYWKGVNLTPEEIILFKKIREELKNQISIHQADKYPITEKIKNLILELIKKIKNE